MHDRQRKSVLELPALALASFSVLGSQIAMTRILSLKYAANQTFLVVSFAVLGLAIGAGIAHRWRNDDRDGLPLPALGMLGFSAALVLLLAVFHLNLSAMQQIWLVPLPFAGVGVCIASVFARRASRAGFYYAVDLAGAAAGAFGAAPLLDLVPAPTAMLLFAASGGLAAVLFWNQGPAFARVAAGVGLGGAGVVVVLLGLPGRPLPIFPDRIKDMLAYVAEARKNELNPDRIPFVESSRWSAFGRTDVLNDLERRQRKVLFVDGAAGSPMFVAPERMEPATRTWLENAFGPSLALRLTAPERKRTALAIGSGGGRDVLACRMSGVGHVTAVELNPDVVDIVREQAEFNGSVYDGAPDVEVVVEEGRHFLRASNETYDVILLSIPVTKRGEGYGGFALSESYLFTRESLGEYLDHLTPEGQLLIVCHTRQEVGRLINTYLVAAADRGLTPPAAMQRVGVFGDMLITVVITADLREGGYWSRLERETRRLGLARPERLFYFMPGPSAARATPALAAVAQGAAPAIVFPRMSTSTYEPDMSPVTDDRPFFYFFTGSLPPLVRTVLIASAIVLVVMIGWGLFPARPSGTGRGEQVLWRLGVTGLGIAFMLVEVPLIQRFVFWFGRPTLALGLLLGTLLLATGLGSLLAGMFVRGRLARTWPVVAVLGVFCMIGFLPAQTVVFAGADGSFADALVRSIAITVPLGLLMGVPFPMLLTGAGAREGVSVAWLWGINGVGSVVGSAASVAIAMLAGYSVALMLAGGVYVATAVVIFALARSAPRAGA